MKIPQPETLSDTDKSLKGKPRRNLQMFIGVAVTIVLVGALFYSAGKKHEKAEKNAGKTPITAMPVTPNGANLKDLINSQVKQALAKREKENKATEPPGPGTGGIAGIPAELQKMISNGGRATPPTHAYHMSTSVTDQRAEAAAASPIFGAMQQSFQSTGQSAQEGGQGNYQGALPPGLSSDLAAGQSKKNATGPNSSPLAQSIAALAGAQGQRTPTTQERDVQWMKSQTSDEGHVTLTKVGSPYVVNEGTAIPAITVTRIDSDLPGMVTARISHDIYDTTRGQWLLIPKGSRVIGSYDSQVSAGQDRVLMAFNRIILPDGDSIFLNGMEGADMQGTSGFSDEVNNHFWKIFGSSFLIAGVAGLIDGNQTGSTINIYGSPSGSMSNAAGQALVNTTQAILARNQSIPPTLIIRQGYKFNIMVTKDMYLQPYGANQ